ncbi:MAG: FxsA family protein [Pseudomonadota bacterium]|nr:FxsA family protein [Pseudomonadota bacterium]
MMFLIFLVVLFLELFAFYAVGSEVGGFYVFLWVVLTLLYGVSRLKMGVAGLGGSSSRNQQPSDQVLDGLIAVMGSVLIIIPGFLTDAIGFLMLLPFVRHLLRHSILDSVLGRYTYGMFNGERFDVVKEHYQQKKSQRQSRMRDPESLRKQKVVDADFEVVDEDSQRD